MSSKQHVFIAQNSGATYQRDVRESLRKISELTIAAWIVLFRKQSEIVAKIKQALEQLPRLFFAAEEVQTIGQPKRTGQEYSLVAGQSINTAFLWPIT